VTTRKLLVSFALLALLLAAAPASFAQASDAYQVGYFSANSAGIPCDAETGTNPTYVNCLNTVLFVDQTLRIINTGQTGSPMDPGQGTVCADIYVFDANQEMAECCSCPITANGLQTLSVPLDLTSNTLTATVPVNGVVKVVADVAPPSGCDPRTITAPVNGALRSFGTHLQTQTGPVTETQFQSAPLTPTEQGFLGNACSFVLYLGSGNGQCRCPLTELAL
jgi:hypothetical protein